MDSSSRVYHDADSVDFSISEIEDRTTFNHVLMISPEFFEIRTSLNLLTDESNQVDQKKALNQWNTLVNKYQELNYKVHRIDGVRELSDMVFAANQSLPYIDNQGKKAILSNMATDQRSPEVKFIEDFYLKRGYEIFEVDSEHDFEGMGDAIWHPGKMLIWGGYGHRTSKPVYDQIREILDVDIITLELAKDEFYHLDTCFSILDEKTVMICPEAFNKNGLAKINMIFDDVIVIGLEETLEGMACNAHCPDGENVIIQEGNIQTREKLYEKGFEVHEINTSEFMKSGGSVFCMKMMFPMNR